MKTITILLLSAQVYAQFPSVPKEFALEYQNNLEVDSNLNDDHVYALLKDWIESHVDDRMYVIISYIEERRSFLVTGTYGSVTYWLALHNDANHITMHAYNTRYDYKLAHPGAPSSLRPQYVDNFYDEGNPWLAETAALISLPAAQLRDTVVGALIAARHHLEQLPAELLAHFTSDRAKAVLSRPNDLCTDIQLRKDKTTGATIYLIEVRYFKFEKIITKNDTSIYLTVTDIGPRSTFFLDSLLLRVYIPRNIHDDSIQYIHRHSVVISSTELLNNNEQLREQTRYSSNPPILDTRYRFQCTIKLTPAEIQLLRHSRIISLNFGITSEEIHPNERLMLYFNCLVEK